MTELLALDPGLRYPACALFRDGVLVAASRVKVPGKWSQLELTDRVRRISGEVASWWAERSADASAPPVLAWERPQVYSRRKSKGDPNDLIPLAMMGGRVAGVLACEEEYSYLPAEWAHLTKKAKTGDPWKSSRGRRLRGLLSVAELAAVVPSHDAVDSVGIGLHHLGRFRTVRTYARS